MTATAPYTSAHPIRDTAGSAGGARDTAGATVVRGSVRLALTGDGPKATLSIDDAFVHVSLDTGLEYTYPRHAVYWNPLDAHSVRMEIGEERIFFVSPEPLDFQVLDHPDSQRRLPPLPPIGAHWTELNPPWHDPDGVRSRPTPWTNVEPGPDVEAPQQLESTDPYGHAHPAEAASPSEVGARAGEQAGPARRSEARARRTARARRRRPAPCAHEWRQLRMAGGLTRAVCSECGELSLRSGL